jgi:hypothetical protein
MKAPVFYCHCCLTEMGMERNGSRYRRVLQSMTGQFPCCKQERTLFNLQAYQGKRNPRPVKRPAPVRQSVRAPGQWPVSVRFD